MQNTPLCGQPFGFWCPLLANPYRVTDSYSISRVLSRTMITMITITWLT
jgi:hypothetical protein